ncbi:MAG: hypothetical protein OXI96_11110 [Acidimicrobiaceae bacterium]|nr:hypothetical protein [Acidimicrobiaceae bacterium]
MTRGSASPSLFDSVNHGSILTIRSLCEELIRADTEEKVESVLKDTGYWDDTSAWAVFGANEANASVIGGQQEAAEAALVEKIVNSIDARMLDACHSRKLDPQDADNVPANGMEAVFQWFDHGMKTEQVSRAGNIAAWSSSIRKKHAEYITVAATGYLNKNGFASITVADSGEGQEPDSFASTFCSLNTGNKRSIPFVQGKHTMGGTGALRFCGAGRVHAHNLQLIVSRRNPDYASAGYDTEWGFTIIRRFPAKDTEKTPTFKYLAPDGQVLRFHAAELAIFPQAPEERGRAEPYARTARWGTLTKLYEYIRTTYITQSAQTGQPSLSLLRKLELRMPQALLPVKLYECRAFPRVADKIPTVVLTGIMGRLANLRNPSSILEWGGYPKTLQFRVDEQAFDVTVWAFKKPAGDWRRSDGVLFMLSGQTHATLPDAFFSRRAVDLDALRKSLLVVVDCSQISSSHEAALMMTSRDRLAKSVFADKVKKRLAEALNKHPALKKLRNERARYAGITDEQAQRTVQEFLKSCLLENPDLGRFLIDGTDIPNPHKPFTPDELEPQLRKFPTFFRLRKARDGHLKRDAPLERSYYRFVFETDARDDYFDRHDAPGVRFLDIVTGDDSWDNADHLMEGWHLSSGTAEMRLRLPDDAGEGEVVHYKFTVADDNPETSEFVSTIELTVQPPEKPGDPGPSKPRRQPPKGNAPEIKPVYESQWSEQVPEPFDSNTALRKVDTGEGSYEFRYNADNKWLRKEILRSKASNDTAEALTHQFGAIMAALALAVMGTRHQQLTLTNAEPEDASDPDGNSTRMENVNDMVDWCTKAAAPVVASIRAFTNSSLSANGSTTFDFTE